MCTSLCHADESAAVQLKKHEELFNQGGEGKKNVVVSFPWLSGGAAIEATGGKWPCSQMRNSRTGSFEMRRSRNNNNIQEVAPRP